MSDRDWILEFEGFDPAAQPLRETLCALGNGVFVTRGAAEEARAGGVHYPGTYLAGGYNRLASIVGDREIVNEDLVNFPNWLPIRFRIDGAEWFDPAGAALQRYRLALDLRRGLLVRTLRVGNSAGTCLAVDSQRLVHMGNPHLAAIEYRFRVEQGSARVEFATGLDGSTVNRGVARYRDLAGDHLEVLAAEALDETRILLHVRTTQSRIEMAQVARTRWSVNGAPIPAAPSVNRADNGVEHRRHIELAEGDEVVIEKVVAVRTSRDRATTEPCEDASLDAGNAASFGDLLLTHGAAWQALWRRFDVEVDAAEAIEVDGRPLQLVLRLHAFHLLQTASYHTIGRDVSVPARGLHGEAYRGHIFWDEMFVMPFYTLRAPEIARSLLMYRYYRLAAARTSARAEGYAGAMIPWQSGSNGREETQRVHLNPRSGKWDPDHSRLQRHVAAACVVNVWRYVEATGDRAFLARYGAEMLVEIARFWVSAARPDPVTGQLDIPGVMGPDEFHEKYPGEAAVGLRKNAYTNVMASWCLTTADRVVRGLSEDEREELKAAVALTDEEPARWREAAGRLAVATDRQGRLLAFEGYDELLELDWPAYRDDYGKIGRLDRILKAEGDSPDRYKLSKQPDLCMLFYTLGHDELRSTLGGLGYTMTEEEAARTIAYYRDRTSHGSTLSHVVFAEILHRRDPASAWGHFLEAVQSDLADTQGGTTPEGIHTAVMAGTIAVVLGAFAGVRVTADAVVLSPKLPPALRRVSFRILWRGTWLSVSVTAQAATITHEGNRPLPVSVAFGGKVCRLDRGVTRRFTVDETPSSEGSE